MEKGRNSIEFFDESTDGYDAVVVGSGYGGSVAACRLSMAGNRVCLIEKGRRCEARDFPTDSLGIMSVARMEWKKWGVGFGPKDALFQGLMITIKGTFKDGSFSSSCHDHYW